MTYKVYIYPQGAPYPSPNEWVYKYVPPVVKYSENMADVLKLVRYWEDRCTLMELFEENSLVRRWKPKSRFCSDNNRVLYYNV